MSDSHSHHDMTDAQVRAHHAHYQKKADKGEYWYVWVVVGIGSLLLALWIWGPRGLGLWLIVAAATAILQLVEIKSAIFAAVVVAAAAILLIAYVIVAFQVA